MHGVHLRSAAITSGRHLVINFNQRKFLRKSNRVSRRGTQSHSKFKNLTATIPSFLHKLSRLKSRRESLLIFPPEEASSSPPEIIAGDKLSKLSVSLSFLKFLAQTPTPRPGLNCGNKEATFCWFLVELRDCRFDKLFRSLEGSISLSVKRDAI